MAEIRVQPNKGSLAWLWVLLLLAVVAAAVWFFYFKDATPATQTTGALPTLPGMAVHVS